MGINRKKILRIVCVIGYFRTFANLLLENGKSGFVNVWALLNRLELMD